MSVHAPNDQLGRYRLRRLLGAGGMGEVWEAELEGPGGFRKPVALKLLHGARAGSGSEALLNEARLGALLSHPNVVSVHVVEWLGDGWVVAMELVRGTTLRELLRSGPLPPHAILDVGVQACAGLAHIHGLRVEGRPVGLVHRDIKLSNLLIDRSGLVKIADLGVAAVSGQGGTAGTPGFAPPEQWAGEAETRSDLFALAVTLYACATRRRLFSRDRDEMRAMTAPLPAARFESVEAHVPGLGAVLRWCLHPDPTERPRSAERLERALSAVRGDLSLGPGLLPVIGELRPDLYTETPSGWATPGPAPRRTRGNLPRRRKRFFGRRSELAALMSRLSGEERLITLLGQGGMGKTGLALEAAVRVQQAFAGGVWFVDLSEARSVEGIVSAVARQLGVRVGGGGPAHRIGALLGGRGQVLIVLDNLEACVEHLAPTLGVWLDQAPQAIFLCTSRILLGLAAERAVPIGPLDHEAAVSMFVERAPRDIPRDQLGEVRGLVDQLDRLPLAIELAAARTSLMRIPELSERLGLHVLSGGGDDLPERHRSLVASLDWSWQLLGEEARTALTQISVCEGGLDLDAAEALVRVGGNRAVFDVVQELVDASLLRVDSASGRLSLLTVVQAFASQQLRERGALERRHGDWFAQLRDDIAVDDLDNVIVACRRAVGRGDRPVAAGCALGAWRVLSAIGPPTVAVELLESARACSPGGELDAELAVACCQAMSEAGDPAGAERVALAALEPARASGDLVQTAKLLGLLGMMSLELGRRDEALERCEEALSVARAAGTRRGQAACHGYLGFVLRSFERLDAAEQHLRAQLALNQGLGRDAAAARVRGNLALVLADRGALDQAITLLQGAIASLQTEGNGRSEAIARSNLGEMCWAAGRPVEARRELRLALQQHRNTGSQRFEGRTLWTLAMVDLCQGHFEEAMAGLDEAERLLRAVNSQAAALRTTLVRAEALSWAGQTDAAEAEAEPVVAQLRVLGDLAGVSRGLVVLAGCARQRGDRQCVTSMLDEAVAVSREQLEPTALVCALTTRAQQHVLHGQSVAARGLIDEARERLSGIDMPALWAWVRCAEAALATLDGDAAGAARELAGAREVAATLGAGPRSPLGQRLASGRWWPGG